MTLWGLGFMVAVFWELGFALSARVQGIVDVRYPGNDCLTRIAGVSDANAVELQEPWWHFG